MSRWLAQALAEMARPGTASATKSRQDSTRAHGMSSIKATCHAPGCHRSADVSLDGFPDDMPIPDIAPLLKCSARGGKRVTVMTNMREWYALCRARKLGVP